MSTFARVDDDNKNVVDDNDESNSRLTFSTGKNPGPNDLGRNKSFKINRLGKNISSKVTIGLCSNFGIKLSLNVFYTISFLLIMMEFKWFV